MSVCRKYLSWYFNLEFQIDLNKIGALEDAKDNDEDDEIPRKF